MAELERVDDLMRTTGVAFGTSGARGRVDAMTDRVCFAYAQAFLVHLEGSGQLGARRRLALAGDLRSSTRRIMVSVASAAEAVGFEVEYCGRIPTPALAAWAMRERVPAVMVTGSHIPDDRNGIKFYTPAGEILKADEAAIRTVELEIPDRFDPSGALEDPVDLPEPDGDADGGPSGPIDARHHYVRRFVDGFADNCLAGLRVGFYGHSGVGREVLPEILEQLGAQVGRLAYADRFIAVDTEAIRPEDVALAAAWAQEKDLDAIVTTDGDGDRPLVADEQGRWIRGDVAGILVARHLGAKTIVTPVNSNTAVEKTGWFEQVIRTRIGSPYVITAMNEALESSVGPVVGYEANGGFLTASSVLAGRGALEPLPTRDAAIVIVSILDAANRVGQPVSALLRELPARYTASDRLRDFDPDQSRRRLDALEEGGADAMTHAFGHVAGTLQSWSRIDGLRMTFASGDVVHLRPSGNAPELRCYTEAGSDEESRTLLAEVLRIADHWR